jgi:GxxExxY protein
MPEIIYKHGSFVLLGLLYEVYNNLGKGFSEIVYKDALEYELKNQNIAFEREKEYSVNYKNIILKHKFFADFVIFDKIILEIKCCETFNDTHIAQCMNYLKVSKHKLAILANFNRDSLEYKRIVL